MSRIDDTRYLDGYRDGREDGYEEGFREGYDAGRYHGYGEMYLLGLEG